jgi:PAS domain S-box-containing protein
MYEIYGLQALGRPVIYEDWLALIDPDDADQLGAELESLLQGQATFANLDIRFSRPDGQLGWVQSFSYVQRDREGRPVRMVGINQDITERKQAEADLQAQTNRLTLALQAGSYGVGEWDFVTPPVWNEQMYRIYGLQDLGRPPTYQDWRDLLHPDDSSQVEAQLSQVQECQDVITAEFRIWRPDGELRWVQAFVQAECDGEGKPLMMVSLTQDITERKQAELELQCLASRLSLALQAGHIGFWLWDLDQDLFWDPSLCRIYGLSETDQITDWQTWRNLVHPEDIDPVEALLQAALQGAPYEGTEFRIYRTDGALRWIQSSAHVQRDGDGQPLHMIGINQDITERKQAELTLKEQTSRLTLALRAGSYGIWEWDLGSNLLWDDQIYQDYGLQDLGRPITYPDWRGAVHPDDIPWVEAQLEAGLQARIPFNAEFRIRRPDGDVRWVVSTAKLYCDGQGQPLRMVGLHQDITHRKQAEQEIQRSRAKFQRLVDDIGDRFVIFSHTGTVVTYVSGGLQSVFGLPPEAVLGQPWATAINWYPESLALAQAEVQRLLTERLHSQEFEMAFTRPDGEVRTIHVVQHSVWDEASNPLAIEGLIEDITERKATESALRYTNAELERATRLKDEFLANMSHELRTPLNAILGMTEGLQEEIFGPLTERQQRSLDTVQRSSTHLLSLINDILDLSKIEAGQFELDFGAIGVSPLCKASVTFVKQQAHKKHQQIATLIPEGLPDLYGDDRRLHQVLINLLTNAVKFTPDGGQVTLAASYTALAPTALDNTWIHPQANPGETLGLLSLSVSDTGIGISPEDAQKLFQPFVQVNAALNRQHEGTGLGLSLVKRIVNAHGGEVTLVSELGHGSCFTVQIPIIAIPGESFLDAVATAALAAIPSTEPAAAPLILLAEDNEANISTITSYLEAKGYRLIVARHGLEAVTLAATAQPDLIVMDIQMPHLDGLEAIRQIRQNPALVTVPIIALTALAMPIDEERCLAAGANQYLSKPIRLKQLFQRITAALAPIFPPFS